MASRLTVIFFIVLCLEAGVCLTVLPWWQPWGMGGWGDNYFLVFAAQKIGSPGLLRAVASGWVRGAVTGLGLLNLAMRSEERRVGKECRCRWWQCRSRKKCAK